ncbi:hypothetical protein [Acinetobacter calcoaceticus]|uniref:hypothetical protein n=1 Tax=Acinetobacter calcoaceticus TaxID=471 RepID=UPI001E2A0181|nr:hypothetical protein [Acinetobacter calcoaceticus]UGQ25299.1 hypothetical protein LRO55_13065 [Acinetobacter calcoaceticus]
MKKIYILTCSALLLMGCQTTSSMKNSITFVVGPSQHGLSFVFKNNWPKCGNFKSSDVRMGSGKYITFTSTCKIEPEGYIPEQIVIEYAPWLTMEQIEKEIGEYPQKALSDITLGFATESQKNDFKIWNSKEQQLINKIPASAWKKVVLYPPQDVAKYKNQLLEGKGNKSRGKEIHYIISLNPDGTYAITTKLYWKVPYQTNWN